ncbi:hypothetical protein E2C01_028910 [Portunus trituberculatus]|uniref:Uncharacterized protein n=1 Tax=Portunus trituberculatus TaxID=210409 RepID=A0A5B7EQI4_PORTR|nr:hypothetical protein [Portunus trituberculatus]
MKKGKEKKKKNKARGYLTKIRLTCEGALFRERNPEQLCNNHLLHMRTGDWLVAASGSRADWLRR